MLYNRSSCIQKTQYLTRVNHSAQFLDNRDGISNRYLILVYIEPLWHLKVHRVAIWRVLGLEKESLVTYALTHVAGTARAYDPDGFLEMENKNVQLKQTDVFWIALQYAKDLKTLMKYRALAKWEASFIKFGQIRQ